MKIKRIKSKKAVSALAGGIAGLAALDTAQADVIGGLNQSAELQKFASDNIDQLVQSYLTDSPVDQLHAEAMSGAEIGDSFPESNLLESLMARGDQFAQAELGAAGAAGGGAAAGAGAAGAAAGAGAAGAAAGAGAAAAGAAAAGAAGLGVGGIIAGGLAVGAIASQASGC